MLKHTILMSMLVAGIQPVMQAAFTPDFRVKRDDYTVLMFCDGTRPEGARPMIGGRSHLKFQMQNWKVGSETSWEVEVEKADEYAVNVLFNHTPQFPLRVEVSSGASSVVTISQYTDNGNCQWKRLPLEGKLQLSGGKRKVTARITAEGDLKTPGGMEVMSVELVRSQVMERLHADAMAMRARTDTQWFRKAKYGLMFHWTSTVYPRSGERKPYNQAVREFDMDAFVKQVVESGAGFVTFTTSHAEMYFPAPLQSLERILPGRTAERDLVGEMAEALGKRGIGLMLYFHLGSADDEQWLQASGFWQTDTSRFWECWTQVVGEAGERYGDKLAGWWFDDGTGNYYYRSAPWKRLAEVAKAGSAKRLVCFNPWVLPPATEFQDYLAGEGFGDPSLGGCLREGDRGRISSGRYEGLQASAALVLESSWAHGNMDTAIGASRYTVEQLANLMRRFIAFENVPMFNCEIYQGGTVSPATVDLFRTAKTNLILPKGAIPVTDANVLNGISRYNWVCKPDYMGSTVNGASVTVGFKGTRRVALRVDTEHMKVMTPSHFPVIAWSINGGPIQAHQLAGDEKAVLLATEVADPAIALYVKGFSPYGDRYQGDVPSNSLKITGFAVDEGGTTRAVALPQKVWINIGDSIMSGDGAAYAEKQGRPKEDSWAASDDGRASYGYLLARHYGYRESRIATGGYGWGGGMANMPALMTLIDQRTSTTSRLKDGALSPVPDVVLVNLGENGVPPDSMVVETLAKLRSRVGKATKLVLMIPVSGKGRVELTRAFNAYKASAKDACAYLVDLGPIKYARCDGQHPTASGHRSIYEAALPLFDAILGPGDSTADTHADPRQ
jgi:hypothetical protein